MHSTPRDAAPERVWNAFANALLELFHVFAHEHGQVVFHLDPLVLATLPFDSQHKSAQSHTIAKSQRESAESSNQNLIQQARKR